MVQRKYKKSAIRGKHRGNWKLGQDVTQIEKWELSAICGKRRRNGKCIGSFSGKRSLVWDNMVKQSRYRPGQAQRVLGS